MMMVDRALEDLIRACVADLVEAMIGEGVEVRGRGTGIGLHVKRTGIVDDLVLLPLFCIYGKETMSSGS